MSSTFALNDNGLTSSCTTSDFLTNGISQSSFLNLYDNSLHKFITSILFFNLSLLLLLDKDILTFLYIFISNFFMLLSSYILYFYMIVLDNLLFYN